jgi:membrane peptidoglycan carboxypeptidase
MIKFIKKLLLLIIIVLIVITGIYIYRGYKLYKDAIEEISIEEKVNQIKEKTENYTKYEVLPKDYINAVLAVEDRNFFKHNGINIISIGRAVVMNIKEQKIVEGGSTITQQLAKNIYFNQKKEITRKVAEVFMTFKLEQNLEKEEIFELYVNTIYFGDGYYNIYDACHGYFDKEVKDMDLYESTLLAGIPNAPSVYAPTKNPELAKQRQNQVLKKMVKYHYLTKEEADAVIDSIE